ncbi:MAG: glycosyltransferase family 1 protein [Caldilineaceae bacterium]
MSRPPRIVIDYTPAVRQQAGIGRIIRGQVQGLLDAATGWEIHLFVVGRVSEADRKAAPLPLHTTPLDERNMVRIWHRLGSPVPRVDWFTGCPIDLFHATDFVLAPSAARRKLLTVHDLAFLFYPDAAMPSLHRYLNVVVPASVRRSDHILADSYNTAKDLQEQWQVAPEKISVVQGAVDHQRFQPVQDTEKWQAARAKYKIGDQPFIFALSRLEPRKNFARLIEAFAIARDKAHLPHRLVIGGSKGWLYESIFAKVSELQLQDLVLFPGFIDDADLPTLFSAAEFFAYPSLYEGFGLPILEAQACGAAVLTADNSCLPEAGGEGALYVQATDVESIVTGILKLAEDSQLRQQYRRAALINAAQFTWERSAEQLIEAYRKELEIGNLCKTVTHAPSPRQR